MYNFTPNHKIPLHPPIAIISCLKPWFESDVLERGLALLRETALSHFFFHRQAAGALLHDQYPLTIVYEKTTRIHQGFTLKTQHCSLCGYSRHRKRCEHIAALCLLSLIERSDRPLLPMPLLFRNSGWGKLASFLHDWLDGEKGQLDRTADEKKTFFKRTASEGGLQAQISHSTATAWELFNRESTPSMVVKLYESIQNISLSKIERELISAGSSSRGVRRDVSIWSSLCTLFYGLGGEKLPTISYEEKSGLFLLYFHNEKTSDLLKIYLPKHRTLEILGQLIVQEPAFFTLEPACQGFQVKMDEQGQIVVNPLVWRGEKQTILLKEISDRKFGNSYFFPGEGFLPLKKHDSKGKIIRPSGKQAANPLFDFIKQDSSFVVVDNERHDFLKENRTALTHPHNQVDRKILSLQIKELPD